VIITEVYVGVKIDEKILNHFIDFAEYKFGISRKNAVAA
jgi:hypothetical protein